MLSDRIYAPGDEELVYHYCTPETFLAICSHKHLRFSDLYAMNDFMEVRWGYDMWMRAATYLATDIDKSFLDEIDGVIRRTGERALAVASCMSRNGDVLSQWRAYATDGKGFAIGFHAQTLQRMAVRPFRVEYRPEAQVAEICAFVRRVHAQYGGVERHSDSPFEEECETLAIDLAAFKNPAFSEEDEIRLVHALVLESTGASARLIDPGGFAFGKSSEPVAVEFHLSKGIPVAHVDLDFSASEPKNMIRALVLGPRCEASTNSISIFLETVGLTGVKVTKSTASYR